MLMAVKRFSLTKLEGRALMLSRAHIQFLYISPDIQIIVDRLKQIMSFLAKDNLMGVQNHLTILEQEVVALTMIVARTNTVMIKEYVEELMNVRITGFLFLKNLMLVIQ